MLLNLNPIHTRSNWLCWNEKFQVESRFCKRIGCSYVTLLTTYLAKKLENIRSQKTSERRHLTTSYLLEATDQNHLLESFSHNIYQFAIKNLLAVLLSSSTARNFNNSRPIYVILWKMRIPYRNIWFMKISNCQHFLFLKKQPQKWIHFSTFYLIFKGPSFQYYKGRHPNFL